MPHIIINRKYYFKCISKNPHRHYLEELPSPLNCYLRYLKFINLIPFNKHYIFPLTIIYFSQIYLISMRNIKIF